MSRWGELIRHDDELGEACLCGCNDAQSVQCWHIEPDTTCDFDVCRQPERLAGGDSGTDPADGGLYTPNLDALRRQETA